MDTPKDMQVCAIKIKGRDEWDYAVWTTDYSIYGAGGHFMLPGGAMVGIPVDVESWSGTHWIATETPDIASPAT